MDGWMLRVMMISLTSFIEGDMQGIVPLQNEDCGGKVTLHGSYGLLSCIFLYPDVGVTIHSMDKD
jgi:hypothetical protein